MQPRIVIVALLSVVVAVMLHPSTCLSDEDPVYLRDRGTGIPVSVFGTYINKGELFIYPFYEFYHDNDLEYEPGDFGYGSTQVYRGRYRAHEGLLFIGYGISDRLAVEFEAGIISARLDKSKNDPSAVPTRIKESGVNDVEGQIRWRWNYENVTTPEFFNYFEFVLPTGKKNSLIGTSDWELKFGTGLIKGFEWGTMTLRAALNYSAGEKKGGLGEYALEYLKRISDRFRLVALVEGTEDEVGVIAELQWCLGHNLLLKVNNGFGVTSKATDFAPEIGIIISFP